MTKNSKTQVPVPVVTLTNNKLTTTSINVAEVFGKQHCNVIRDIEKLKANCSESFTALNFEVSDYKDSTGRTLPMYNLTRDGLTLLVMGYTGKKAMQFKEAYIEAFNRMEAQLKGEAQAEALPAPGQPASALPGPSAALRDVMREWARVSSLHPCTHHRQLKAALGLKSIVGLSPEQEAKAVEWVRSRIAAPEKPEKQDTITRDLCRLVTEALAGKSLDEQIAIRQRVKAALEGAPASAETASAKTAPPAPTEAAPAKAPEAEAQPLTLQMVVRESSLFSAEEKRRCTEWSVGKTLEKSLVLLENAFQHSSLIDPEGRCPIKGFRKSLFQACRRNIGAAWDLTHALIAAEKIELP